MDSKFDNVSPGCYRITIGFNDDTSLIKDYQTRLSRDTAWNDLVETISKGMGAIICDDQDNKVMVTPNNIKYIHMSTADPRDVMFGKTSFVNHDEVAPRRTTVGSYNLDSGEFFEDVDEDYEDDEVCTADCHRADLIEKVEDLLSAGYTTSALTLLDHYLSDEGRDDRMARCLRNSIMHGDWNCYTFSENIVRDTHALPDDCEDGDEDHTNEKDDDDSEMHNEYLPQRVTVKLIDGTMFVRDFPSREEANSAIDSLYFFARHKEGNVMHMNSRDEYHQFSPYAVSHISSEPANTSRFYRDWVRIDGCPGIQRIPARRRIAGPKPGIHINPTGVGPAFTIRHRR